MQFFTLLPLIHRQDPLIYRKELQFFPRGEGEEQDVVSEEKDGDSGEFREESAQREGEEEFSGISEPNAEKAHEVKEKTREEKRNFTCKSDRKKKYTFNEMLIDSAKKEVEEGEREGGEENERERVEKREGLSYQFRIYFLSISISPSLFSLPPLTNTSGKSRKKPDRTSFFHFRVQ